MKMRREMLAMLVAASVLFSGDGLAAQVEVDLGVYAGVMITGNVGQVYAVESSAVAEGGTWECEDFVWLAAASQLWVATDGEMGGRRFYRVVEVGGLTNMVFIRPGTFRMGSPANEFERAASEGPQTEVTLSRGYWMGRHEVTQGEYLEVMGENPSFHNGVRGAVDWGTDLSRPVERVSWDDAVRYCSLLSARERAAGRIPVGTAYRLPTEAEWEYACRALTSSRYSFGDDLGGTNLTEYAWYYGNRGSLGGTHPVGGKLPNPWGLYDMHGNVFEWCLDFYWDYPGGRVSDPAGGASGTYRTFRGGAWSHNAHYSRSAHRSSFFPSVVGDALGFRVVLAPVAL
jgi:formylglycine-generating enzyme required for sulfatase activity